MRRALADVLAVTTGAADGAWWREHLDFEPRALRIESRGVSMYTRMNWVRWAHGTPADALAALVEAALLPEHWCDPERTPQWWCEACGGDGAMAPGNYGADDGDLCWSCGEDRSGDAAWPRGRGVAAVPPSHAALVAVATLGADTLARREAIVAETWRARVVWRVMAAKAIQEHHASMENVGEREANRVCVAFSREANDAQWPPNRVHVRERWPLACPYGYLFGTPDDDRHDVHRTWPAVRAIARTEDGGPSGVHLVAIDADRVTLAVEAL